MRWLGLAPTCRLPKRRAKTTRQSEVLRQFLAVQSLLSSLWKCEFGVGQPDIKSDRLQNQIGLQFSIGVRCLMKGYGNPIHRLVLAKVLFQRPVALLRMALFVI